MTTSTTDKVKEGLLELEQQYWRAIQERDVEAAVELTDFPCIIAGARGIGRVEEPAYRKMMENPPYRIHVVELGDAELKMLGDDIAILAYKVHEELTVDGESVTLDAADSSTWIRRDGRWRCAAHTETVLGDSFGRDRKAQG